MGYGMWPEFVASFGPLTDIWEPTLNGLSALSPS